MVVVVRSALFVLHMLVLKSSWRSRVVPPSFAGALVRIVSSALVFWSPYRVLVSYRGVNSVIVVVSCFRGVLHRCSI